MKQKLHLPISWQQPYRHISQPARPVWLSEPAARGRPCLSWFRSCVRVGDRGVFGENAVLPLQLLSAVCATRACRCTLSQDCVISCEGGTVRPLRCDVIIMGTLRYSDLPNHPVKFKCDPGAQKQS